MRIIKLIIILILIVLAVRAFGADTNAQESLACPEGTTTLELDERILCKISPTGCPYGDSIPLGPECDKHAPETIENSPNVQGISDSQDQTPILGK
jgi:hypothetical protein